MSSNFNFTVILFLGNVLVKPYFNTQGGGGGGDPVDYGQIQNDG